MHSDLPSRQGLYRPEFEKDNCGVGFIANINGDKSHNIVSKGIEILVNMTHRGASGSDPNTGDGAGIMFQIPHDFFKIVCNNKGIELPLNGEYAVGMIFLPKSPAIRYQCEGILERIVNEEGAVVLGWRTVPTDNRLIGETAWGTEPNIRQIFIGLGKIGDKKTFGEKLYLIRKRTENEVKKLVKRGAEHFYICSLSSETVVYKGLLLPQQMSSYFLDLSDINFKSAIAMVHSRFSTNTFPTWDLAHPYRYIAHNGEINTIRGNRNWMNAREGVLNSSVYGKSFEKTFPIITPNGSDSASLDNVFELLIKHGKSCAQSMMMLIPEAWDKDETMAPALKAFYETNGSLIEAWDGPAAVFFCDGVQVGATLDRNGLRPAKYIITKSGMMVMASELGVLKFNPEEILEKGRLEPGKMILVDTGKGKIIRNDAIKAEISSSYPFEAQLVKTKLTLDHLPVDDENYVIREENLLEKQAAFNYSLEDVNLIIKTMAETGKEALGSMGNDAPLSVLSDQPQHFFAYFRQLFAQVTNPPIDPIREKNVMSLVNYMGSQASFLEDEPSFTPFISIKTPVLTNAETRKIKALRNPYFNATKIPITFKADEGVEGFKKALRLICERASKRVSEGYNILILSDKKVDGYEAAIPSLLAVSSVHHHLIREKTRTKVSIIIESGDVRETTHIALLIGYGASAVNPYLAIETAKSLVSKGIIKSKTAEEASYNLIDALSSGLLKILSKMGICTVQSYQGAQIFEALGLSDAFVDQYFPGTPTSIGGLAIEEIASETLNSHKNAFNRLRKPMYNLEIGGQHVWRKGGERHLFNPETIYLLQQATRLNDYKIYKNYANKINDQSRDLYTIRGLFELQSANAPVPLDEVEPISEIIKRFCTGAMSFGSLSQEVHETIAIAMNRLGAKSNSGEGGEDESRYPIDANGNDKRSAIKQIASARFGVNTNYIMNADELQIKIAQGAKPGEGGHLPGDKVTVHIAKVRHATAGIDLISPPPHHDIYSIEDLAQLIYDLKTTNPDARISVKLVAEVGIGTIAAGVAKAHADMILISGHDGGTGASPLSSIKSAGIPWEIGLSETHQVLLLNNLRSRVRLQTDGQLKTGRDVVIAALLGAEEFGFASTALVVMGCTMLRHCNKNNCDLGIATQHPELRKHFNGKPEYLINFMRFLATDVRELMAELGFRKFDELVGQVGVIKKRASISHEKAKLLDLDKILYKPDMPSRIKLYCVREQEHGIANSFDNKLVEIAKGAIKYGYSVKSAFEIRNTDRAVGAMLSGKIVKSFGAIGLPEDTVELEFFGSAGQSFGAFGAPGVTLTLEGEANDYVGKGLSGAKLIVKPPKLSTFNPSETYIVGNTVLYGATAGEVYIYGLAGERFAVRNSGANAVIEGVGNHGCEYMTGGNVVILGAIGKNFAAGMSGGYAFVYDDQDTLRRNLNGEMVSIYTLSQIERAQVKALLVKYMKYTQSKKAISILKDWEQTSSLFKLVSSPAYRRFMTDAEKSDESKENFVDNEMDIAADISEGISAHDRSSNQVRDALQTTTLVIDKKPEAN